MKNIDRCNLDNKNSWGVYQGETFAPIMFNQYIKDICPVHSTTKKNTSTYDLKWTV